MRSEREEPPASRQTSLKAVEETRVIFVPKAERAKKAYVDKGIAEAKQILDEPSPQIPQGLLDEPDFGGDQQQKAAKSWSSHDPITEYWEEQKAKEERKGETTATSSSSGLAAPPLYAAGIPRVQPPSSPAWKHSWKQRWICVTRSKGL